MSSPEGTPNGDDRLAQIEAAAEDAEGGRWCSMETADVLALVEIAREALAYVDEMEREGIGDYQKLADALARLDESNRPKGTT